MRHGADILLNPYPSLWSGRWTTLILWVSALSLLAVTWAVMTTPPSLALQPFVPESFTGYFNLFIVIGWPFEAAALLADAFVLWAVVRRAPARGWRLVSIAAVSLIALALPAQLLSTSDPMSAVSVLAYPGVLLIYVVPVLTCATYAAFANRPTLPRMLGVMALAAGVGLLLYVAGWSLLCGETD